SVPITSIEGNWKHIALTWDAGTWAIYIDGDTQQSGKALAAEFSITDAIVVLGQDQDTYGGGFDPNQVFLGSLTGGNIWSRVLSAQEIAQIASECNSLEGDTVKWGD
ncbi:predicted protein, partial [Nematostella vectensis]